MIALLDDDFFLELKLHGPWQLAKYLVVFSLTTFLTFLTFSTMLPNVLADMTFKQNYLDWLLQANRQAPVMAILTVVSIALRNLISHPFILQQRKFIQKLYVVNTMVAFLIISLVLVVVSMVSIDGAQ